jgi:hypothetical protein
MFPVGNVNDYSDSYRFLNNNPDAYNHSVADSDNVNFTSAATFNNPSSLAFTKRVREAAITYLGEHLIDHSKFEQADKYTVLYNGFYGGIGYVLPLNVIMSKLKIPVAASMGLTAVSETVMDQTKTAFLFDSGVTALLLKKKLYTALSLNNYGIGLGNTQVPFKLSLGAKYHIDQLQRISFLKKFRFTGMANYKLENLLYNSLSLGMNVTFLNRYSLRFGGKFDVAKKGISYNNSFNFGMGVRLKFLEIDFSFMPAYSYTMNFVVSVKSFIYQEDDYARHRSAAQIRKMSLEEIIFLARKAIDNKDYKYAELLVKIGVVMAPDNEELLDMLDLLVNQGENF